MYFSNPDIRSEAQIESALSMYRHLLECFSSFRQKDSGRYIKIARCPWSKSQSHWLQRIESPGLSLGVLHKGRYSHSNTFRQRCTDRTTVSYSTINEQRPKPSFSPLANDLLEAMDQTADPCNGTYTLDWYCGGVDEERIRICTQQ